MPLPHQEALAQLSNVRAVLDSHTLPTLSGEGSVPKTDLAASLRRVEASLQADRQLWEALHKALSNYLTDTPPQQFLSELLDVLLRLTNSEYGFIGEVLQDSQGSPYLKTHAITNIAWDEASRRLYEAGIAQGLEFRNLQTLFGEVLTTAKPVLANDPEKDPRRGGIPPGHPPLRAFLGLPCHLGPELIGVVGLANRPDGYTLSLSEFLQPVLDTCSVLLVAFRQHQQQQRAEETLRRREERYRALEEHSFETVLLLDAQGTIQYASPTYEYVTGRPITEVPGKAALSEVHTDDLSTATAALTRCLENPGQPVACCVRMAQADGLHRWIEATGCNWLDQPDIQAIVVNCRDVTARHMAEERQRRLEQERGEALLRLQLLLDHMPMACIQNDPEGHITYWNPAAEQLFGYRLEEVQGKHPFGIITPPESQPHVAEIFRRLREGNDPIEAEGINCTREGQRLLCEWHNAPLRGADGGFLGVISMCRDITRQRQTEEARQRSEQLFRAVSEQMPDALFLLDVSDPECPGKIMEVNEAACRMHRFRREELLGQPIGLLHSSDVAAQVPLRLEKLLRGETIRFEGDHLRKDGSAFPAEVVARMISFGDRQLVLKLDRDITERKRNEETRRKLEAQLQHSQKLESLGVLASGIAHDFNNLLTSILGNVSLAAMDALPGSPMAYALQQIETATCRAADLTRQILAYSGKGRFLIHTLDLSQVVEEMAMLLRTVISKKAQLRFEFDVPLPTIKADATQLRQVVMNLITNASDAIGDHNGTITLRTGSILADKDYLAGALLQEDLPAGKYVFVDVADTGCGMDPETLAKIFDPFYTTKHTGRGLGLAAVLGIMRGHRGTLKVCSELGSGTTFRLLFPCIDPPPTDTRQELPAPESRRGGGGILVADLEPSDRNLAARLLEQAGFQVYLADSTASAMELSRQQADRIRLVLWDCSMPGLNGPEVFNELHKLNPDIRVVFMSDSSEPEIVLQQGGPNLASVLHKPFRAADLLVLIQHLLDG